jgi:5-methylcytosine-specific restriction enzyme A
MTARLANPAAAKDPRKTWYSLQLWKNRRAHQLLVEPLCVLCEAEGRVTGATVADHFPAHDGDFNAFVRGPLRSLCAPCHDNLQGFTHKSYQPDIGADGYPLDPRHPWYKQR